MELILSKFDLLHVRVRNSNPCGIGAVVNFGMDLQSFFRRRCGNEADDHLETGERLTAPVLADEGKQPEFDLVPFTGAGRKMTDCEGATCVVGQCLLSTFPETQSRSVATAAVGSNQQAFGIRVF